MKIGFALLFAVAAAQAGAVAEYVDPSGRFRFSYRSVFGSTTPGTNAGFGDRVAAIRFSNLAGLGGEAVLTRGPLMLDVQAAGGLYDAIALEALPDALRGQVIKSLPQLSVENFCRIIAEEQHLAEEAAVFRGLSAQQAAAVRGLDRLRNVDPKVVRCETSGRTVTFDKQAAFQPGSPPQHIYGAVRFLGAPYSAFQLIRAGSSPTSAVLDQITAVVNSWTPGN